MSERTGKAHTLVLYDGVCALCNRLVRFLLRFDHQDEFRFAALQSEFARQVLERHGIHAAELNTVCVVADYGLAGETALTKSSASLHAVERLGSGFDLMEVMSEYRALRERLQLFGAQVGEVAVEPSGREPGEHAVDLVARQASRQVGHPALAVEGLIEAVRELRRRGCGAAPRYRAGGHGIGLCRARVHRRTARRVGMPRDGRLRASGCRELRVDGIDLHRILLRDAAGCMRTHAPR